VRASVPVIVALREQLDVIRTGEVAKGLARLPHASPETRQAIEALSSAIMDQVLHTTTAKLREPPEDRGAGWASILSELFGLTGSRADTESAREWAAAGESASAL